MFRLRWGLTLFQLVELWRARELLLHLFQSILLYQDRLAEDVEGIRILRQRPL